MTIPGQTATPKSKRDPSHRWRWLVWSLPQSRALDLFGLGSGFSGKKPTPLQLELVQRACQVRAKLGPSPFDMAKESGDSLSSLLFFDSFYSVSPEEQRGFCNWLIPHRLMVGQYPGQSPEEHGPEEDQVRDHIERLTSQANVRLFCSLQTEVPPQTDRATWNKNDGCVYLKPSLRRRFPGPFTHYAPIVSEFCQEEPVAFLQCPIEDLNIPESQEPLQRLLLKLLEFLDDDDHADASIYLHCWGGRGRAGLVAGCLLGLLYPHLAPTQILAWVQAGYSSRLGHNRMQTQLAISPQTSTQRAFVAIFIREYQRYFKQSNSGAC